MISLNESICLISAFSFAGYGLSCLLTQRMHLEFARYGLASLQKTIGYFQVLGSIGLLLGLYYPPLKVISSLGLSVMMLLAVLVRIRIKDSVTATLPALTFFLVNLYLFLSAIGALHF